VIRYEVSPLIHGKISKILGTPTVINLHRVDEDSARKLRQSLDEAVRADQPLVPIYIDSFGGDVYAMMSIIDSITSAKDHTVVATIAVGKAMSAGAEILTAGTRGHRFVSPLASVMIHDMSGGTAGKIEEIKADAAHAMHLEALSKRLLDKHCGKRQGYFERQIHARGRADWYLTPGECLRHGLADYIDVPDLRIGVGVAYQLEISEEARKSAPASKKKPSKRGRA
jgi:ATP-dependent Clp protease protease subunit